MIDLPCQTVPELLAWRVRQSPHAIACHERTSAGQWRSYTWQEVAAQAALTAAGLVSLGVAPRRGEPKSPIVAVLGRTSYTWWVIELATYHCGCVLAGLDPRLPHSQVLELLARTRPSLIFSDDEALAHQLDADYARHHGSPRWLPQTAGRSWFAWRNLHGPQRQGCTGIDRALWRETAATKRMPDLHAAALLSPSATPHAACDTPFDTAADACETEPASLVPLPQPTPHSQATLLFTSGTTGIPKGLIFRHEQLLLACQSICQAFPDLASADTTLCWLPLAHLFQRVMNLVAIAVGGNVYFEPEPANIMQSLREVQPTIFIGVPKFYERVHAAIEERLASAPWWQQRLVRWALARHAGRFSRPARHGLGRLIDQWLDRHVLARLRETMGRRLRFAITGSAPTPVRLLEFFEQMGILVLEAYGISENAVPLAANRPDAFRFGSVGRPFPNNEVQISASGEVLVRGPGVSAEFLGQTAIEHDQPSRPFTPDGFLRTGDCGRFDEQGYLYLKGRLSERIKTSTGRWVSPARIEQHYLTSPFIEQVVVFADGQQAPVALVYPSRIAREQAMQAEGREQAEATERLRGLIAAELSRLESGLEPHERVSRFALLEEPLSVAAGELTLLFKPRRGEIARRHAALLAGLGFAQPACESAIAAASH